MWTRLPRHLLDGVVNLIYPPVCLACGAPNAAPGAPLCLDCVDNLAPADLAQMERRLKLLALPSDTVSVCFALWAFRKGGGVQHLQHRLKYGNRPAYGVYLGRIIGSQFRDIVGAPPPDLIVPIPLHRARYLERGYNQSAMLARGVSECIDVPMVEAALRRPRRTRTQITLHRAQRWENVAGAFLAEESLVENRHCLVIDDVLTTGATTAAAALALREAGAARVDVAALAYAEVS